MARNPNSPNGFPPSRPPSVPLVPNPRRPSGNARPSVPPVPVAPIHDNSPTAPAEERPRPVSRRIQNLTGLSSMKGEPYAALVDRMKNPGRTASPYTDVGQGIEDRNTSPAYSESGLFEQPVNISKEVPKQLADRSNYVGGVDPSANKTAAGTSTNPYIGYVVTPIGENGLPSDGVEGADGDYDLFPFYFSDFRRPDRIIRFPATLTELSENFDIHWKSEVYYGRVQRVPIYSDTSRSVTVGFKLFAMDDGTMSGVDQVNMLYQKLEALLWLVYPSFKREHVKSATVFENKIENDRDFLNAREEKIRAESGLQQLTTGIKTVFEDPKSGKKTQGIKLTTAGGVQDIGPMIPISTFGEVDEIIPDPRTTPEGLELIAEMENRAQDAAEKEANARERIAAGIKAISQSLVIHKAPVVRMRIGNMIKRAGHTAGSVERRGLTDDALGVSLHDSDLHRDAGLGGYITNLKFDYNIGTNDQKMQILYDPDERQKKANFVSYNVDVSFTFEVIHDETPFGWDPEGGDDKSGMLFYTRWQDYLKIDQVK